jgi:dipeptidyl aminopeptidase/acylaminoacyl peptidase
LPNISIFPENNIIFSVKGEKDYQYQTTKNYHQLLQGKGVAEKLIVYPGEDHGFGTNPGSWDKLIGETAAFFNAH